MVHEDNPEMIWSHTVKGTISKIRTKANTINLIKYGARPYSELNKVETDLWKIAEEIDAHVNELFIELERLRKKCEDNKKTYRCRKCSKEISKKEWDGDSICKKCKLQGGVPNIRMVEGTNGKKIPVTEDHFMNPDSKHFDPDADAHDPENDVP